MRVRRIGSDRHVHRDRESVPVSLQQQAAQPRSRASGRSPAAGPALRPCPAHRGRPAEIARFISRPGLFGRAEAPIGQHRLHVLAGMSGQRDFEIVDGRRAVHREGGGVAAPHQVDQHRRQAALDDVPAQAPR